MAALSEEDRKLILGESPAQIQAANATVPHLHPPSADLIGSLLSRAKINRGWFRVWIVFSCLWLGWAFFDWYVPAAVSRIYQDSQIIETRKDCLGSGGSYSNCYAPEYNPSYSQALGSLLMFLVVGGGVPLGLVGVLFIWVWIRRGFEIEKP